MTSYLRPTHSEWSSEIEIKRSRFIGLVRRTATEEEAREFIHTVRSTYPDARHHCSAYIIHQQDAQPIERSSDDGEPAGTAGQPMLEVLRGTEAMDITAVVVRYFGGVLLGTGGLVRAYQDSVKETLDAVTWVKNTPLELFTVSLPHADAGKIESEIRHAGYHVMDVAYAAEATLTIAGDEALNDLVAQLTGGTREVKHSGVQWVDVPVE